MGILILVFSVILIGLIFYLFVNYLSKKAEKDLQETIYQNFLNSVEVFSQQSDQHHFTKNCILASKLEKIPIEILQFFMQLDSYYREVSLLILIEHRKRYLKENPENEKVKKLYDRLVHMKTKDFIFNVKP